MEQLKSWLPIVLLASGIVASYVTLQAKMAAAEDDIKELDQDRKIILETQREIRQQTALSAQSLDKLEESQKEIKDLLNKLLIETRRIQ